MVSQEMNRNQELEYSSKKKIKKIDVSQQSSTNELNDVCCNISLRAMSHKTNIFKLI